MTKYDQELGRAVALLQAFGAADLTRTLSKIEVSLRGVTAENCSAALAAYGAQKEVLAAAGLLKQILGQINVMVHAVGILLCLPHLLQPGETVEYVSLGAG